MTNTEKSDDSLTEKVSQLEKENKKLKAKIERLKKTMEITSKHGDVVASELKQKVESSIMQIEERVRLISETIPVPVIIANISKGKILYVNEHSCQVFGLSYDEFMALRAPDLYANPSDRHVFLKMLSEQGRVNNYEVKMKKKDGEPIWAALFSQPLNFKNEPCLLTVIYDLTERREAYDEIRRLKEELEQKEEKYLIFISDGIEYGIEILKIREIIQMIPITSVMNVTPYIKGVINLRGRVIPVVDLRLRLGSEPAEYTDRTCIIILETENEERNIVGIIADAVSDVRRIRIRDIEPAPEQMFNIRTRLISGIARTEDGIKIILDSDSIFWD